MKPKFLIIFAACFSLLVGTLAFGSEVGNNPERTGWRFDFGFDHSTKEVELDERAMIYYERDDWVVEPDFYYGYYAYSELINSFDGQETLDKLFFKVSYGWGDRYSFYFKGGMARMVSDFFAPEMYDRYEYYEYYDGEEYFDWYQYDWIEGGMKGKGDWGPFYGAGFKAVFFESGDFRIGLDAQYNLYSMDSDVIMWQWSYLDDDDDELDQHKFVETETTEYHLAIIFSKKNPEVSPYGGFKISGYETEYDGQAYYRYIEDGVLEYDFLYSWELTTKPQDFYGFFLGMDWKMTEMFFLNGEIRVGDETAMTVALSWKF